MLLLLRGPALASVGCTNAGVLALCDRVLTQVDLALGTYPLYADLNEAPATGRAMEGPRPRCGLGHVRRW